MTISNKLRRRLGLAVILGAALGGAIVVADARSAASPPGACVIAEVDGVTVDDDDVRELTSLLSPPPTKERARRLAFDVALAHKELRGFLAGSSAEARLDAYRELMLRLHETLPTPLAFAEGAQALLESQRRDEHVVTGACYVPAPAPPRTGRVPELGPKAAAADVHERFARENQRRPILRVERLWLPLGHDESTAAHRSPSVWALPGVDARYEYLGLVVPSHLAPELAHAALGLRAGEVSAPIRTRDGTHLLRVIERYEPGTLRQEDVARP